MTIPESVQNQIDKTISALNKKKFEADPIAGPHFSRITSVMSSAYKRHGFIIEHAILESVAARKDYSAWEDRKFHVSVAADSLATDFLPNPEKAVESNLPYDPIGPRTLQIDLIAYQPSIKHLNMYEIKRGSGLHDAGKRRQILRDLICMELLAKSYGEKRGLEVKSSRAHAIFYYGKCSIGAPFALTRGDLDEHFKFGVVSEIEEVNALFKKRLFEILSA